MLLQCVMVLSITKHHILKECICHPFLLPLFSSLPIGCWEKEEASLFSPMAAGFEVISNLTCGGNPSSSLAFLLWEVLRRLPHCWSFGQCSLHCLKEWSADQMPTLREPPVGPQEHPALEPQVEYHWSKQSQKGTIQ